MAVKIPKVNALLSIAVVKLASNKTGTWRRYLNYLYFMRFSILLWLSMPLLALFDSVGAAAFTRGIVALGQDWHFFFASFFVAMNGWIALLSARIVCAYGMDRFRAAPPAPWAGVAAGKDMSQVTFWAAQIPGFALLGYVAWRSHQEESFGYPEIFLWFLGGVAMALLCWVLMACIYYWMFWTHDPRELQPKSADNPKAFVVPYALHAGLFKFLEKREPPAFLLVLIELGKIPAKLGPGYKNQARPFNPLHSGHGLAFLNLGFSLAVYGVFWDFTSPIPLPTVHKAVRIAIFVVVGLWALAALFYRLYVLNRRPGGKKASFVDLLLTVVLFLPMVLLCTLPFTFKHNGYALPVLASISVLLLFVTWGLSGLAFFFDRFRVPVSALLLLIFLLQNIPTFFGILLPADHSVQLVNSHDKTYQQQLQGRDNDPQQVENNKVTTQAQNTEKKNFLDTPDILFQTFEKKTVAGHSGPRPVIIVTATGGGIHAAAWTAGILALLENTFRLNSKQLPQGTEFHNSILLMSTVSGGSVGTAPWAAEYLKSKDKDPFTDDSLKAMQKIAGCSELQAVAWGLTYADFLRLVWPYRHFLFSRDFDTYDRGWALQQAFWRNRSGSCSTGDLSQENAREETLGDLAWKRPGEVPAFSFNTTVEETGDRFLSANYMLPRQEVADNPGQPANPMREPIAPLIAPADSFLRDYRSDLPLSSAARLSANFPYVSPMPRVPLKGSKYHFGDGGYYDNDGTSTAIEFLWYALNPGGVPASDPPAAKDAASPPVPVLLIEIRDSNDLPIGKWPEGMPQEEEDAAKKKDSSTTLGQLIGPLETFYNAGHASVTRRNRRELAFLERALGGKAEIHRIVFAYDRGSLDMKSVQVLPWHLTEKGQQVLKTEADEKSSGSNDGGESKEVQEMKAVQALSWHLTTKEKSDICDVLFGKSTSGKSIVDNARDAVDWYHQALTGKNDQASPAGVPDSCPLF